MKRYLIALIASLLAACQSSPPAPVIDRLPQTKPAPPASKSTKPAVAGKDWRPDSYVVKKGDTLFSIGLEFGYDYKEIAAANNISPPYPIKIGQKLSFTSLNKAAGIETKPADNKPVDTNPIENEDGVVVSPIKTDPAGATTEKSTESAVTPVISEPKAQREIYSAEAYQRKLPTPTSTETKSAEFKSTNKPEESPKASDNKPQDDENISWAWPTQGKVIAQFNEASNKGLDIAGTAGQPIFATAPGKVIYTGSDLRGYGKLVIIKHNKVYLSVYAHNSKITVKEGQAVGVGQKIAEMGNTDANTVKLHFEIRRQGKSVDPSKYLPQN